MIVINDLISLAFSKATQLENAVAIAAEEEAAAHLIVSKATVSRLALLMRLEHKEWRADESGCLHLEYHLPGPAKTGIILDMRVDGSAISVNWAAVDPDDLYRKCGSRFFHNGPSAVNEVESLIVDIAQDCIEVLDVYAKMTVVMHAATEAFALYQKAEAILSAANAPGMATTLFNVRQGGCARDANEIGYSHFFGI